MLHACRVRGKALMRLPFLESRVSWVRQRLAHDIAELADQPFCVVSTGLQWKTYRTPRLRPRIPFEFGHLPMIGKCPPQYPYRQKHPTECCYKYQLDARSARKSAKNSPAHPTHPEIIHVNPGPPSFESGQA